MIIASSHACYSCCNSWLQINFFVEAKQNSVAHTLQKRAKVLAHGRAWRTPASSSRHP
uniref:Uncharacterized protein n=1 Tax=Arundo donax TaxID=35708 RepID=A0A0A8Y8C5_ARUDO